jgi:hypothetical protein
MGTVPLRPPVPLQVFPPHPPILLPSGPPGIPVVQPVINERGDSKQQAETTAETVMILARNNAATGRHPGTGRRAAREETRKPGRRNPGARHAPALAEIHQGRGAGMYVALARNWIRRAGYCRRLLRPWPDGMRASAWGHYRTK